MFSGIVQATAEVREVERLDTGIRFWVDIAGLGVPGDSICLDGACHTVEAVDSSGIARFFSSDETLAKTNLSQLGPGYLVNVEPSLTPTTGMGGHFVSGHVDGVATLLAVEPVATSEDSYLIRLRVPAGMERYLVYKGSVCLNGISLTIASVAGEEFTVAVIPYTWHQTNLRKASPGSQLNFEADLLAKYVDKILSFRGQETSEA